MKIRPEQPADVDAIAAVLTAAFGQPAEAQLVDRIRQSDRAWIGLVAEQDGAIVGHVLLSAVDCVGESRRSVWALAPLAVHPIAQRQGIGTALVKAAIEQAEQTDYPFIVVLGHPEFYARCGFEPATEQGVAAPFPASPPAFRIRRLPAYVAQAGQINYPAAFAPVSPS